MNRGETQRHDNTVFLLFFSTCSSQASCRGTLHAQGDVNSFIPARVGQQLVQLGAPALPCAQHRRRRLEEFLRRLRGRSAARAAALLERAGSCGSAGCVECGAGDLAHAAFAGQWQADGRRSFGTCLCGRRIVGQSGNTCPGAAPRRQRRPPLCRGCVPRPARACPPTLRSRRAARLRCRKAQPPATARTALQGRRAKRETHHPSC